MAMLLISSSRSHEASETYTVSCVMMLSVFFHPVRERCRWYARKPVIIISLTTSEPHQMKMGAYDPCHQPLYTRGR